MNNKENTAASCRFGRWFCAHWKQVLCVTFKLAFVTIGVCAAYVIYLLAYDQWDMKYGPCGGRTISEKHGIYVQYYSDGTARLKNLKTGKWTTSKLRWAGNEPAEDSISVYCDRNGLRGFYNTHTGKVTLEAKYRHAWYFSDGVAAVVGDDEMLRFINYDGSEAVPGSYHYSQGYDYVFKEGICEMYNGETCRCGFLRKDGTWAIEQKYYEIDYPNTDGYRIARDEEGYWLYDKDCKLVFSAPYEMIDYAIGRTDVDIYLTRDHVKVLALYDGTVVEPFVIDGTYDLHYMTQYHEDEADEYALDPDLVVYRVNNWEGLMNKHTGKILTPAVYTDFSMISESLIRAELDGGYEDNSVILDRRGNVIRQ